MISTPFRRGSSHLAAPAHLSTAHLFRRQGRLSSLTTGGPVLAALVIALPLLLVPQAAMAQPEGDPTAGNAQTPAAESVTWSVRPSDGEGKDGRSWVELELDPGTRVTEHMIVENHSRIEAEFELQAADGYFTDTGRFSMLSADETSVAAGTWIDLPESVIVPAGGSAVVPFTVTVPDDTVPGDHPAGVAAGVRSIGNDESGNVVGVDSRIGFRVMTRVTGDLVPAAEVTVTGSYDLTWNPFLPGSVEVTYEIANTGNTRLSVAPTISAGSLVGAVADSEGEVIEEIAPGEKRTGSVRLRGVWPLGPITLDVDAQVTSLAPMNAGAGGQEPPGQETGEVAEPAQGSTRVVAIPLPQLIVIVAAAALLVTYRSDKRRRATRLEQMLDEARQQGRAQAEGGQTGASS